MTTAAKRCKCKKVLVMETRTTRGMTYRRKQCVRCKRRFSTIEIKTRDVTTLMKGIGNEAIDRCIEMLANVKVGEFRHITEALKGMGDD